MSGITFNNITYIKFVTMATNGGTVPNDNSYDFTLNLTNDGTVVHSVNIDSYLASQSDNYCISLGETITSANGYTLSNYNTTDPTINPLAWGLFVSPNGYKYYFADMKSNFSGYSGSVTEQFLFSNISGITAIKFVTHSIFDSPNIPNDNPDYHFIVSFGSTDISVNAYNSFDSLENVTAITTDVSENSLNITNTTEYSVTSSINESRNIDPSAWSLYVSQNGTNFLKVDNRGSQTFANASTENTGYAYRLYPIPSTPIVTVNDKQNGTGLTIDWNSYIDPDTTYDVYEITNGIHNNIIENLTYAQTSYDIDIVYLILGSSYSYGVVAKNESGISEEGSNSGIPTNVPDAPTNINLINTGSGNSIEISWDVPMFDGGSSITSYKVYGGEETIIAYVSYATITGLTAGTEYTFTVTALNASGESENSSGSSITPASVPDPPTGLSASDDGFGNSATIVWTAPTNTGGNALTEYRIYDSTYSIVAFVTSELESYQITGLTDGYYSFYMIAVNEMGESEYSEVCDVTIAPYDPEFPPEEFAPDPPTSINATLNLNSTITVTWTIPENYVATHSITGYIIYINNVTSSSTSQQSVTDTEALEQIISGLHAGSSYNFQISGVNVVGESTLTIPTSNIYIPYACFIGSTKVTMADGSMREIKDVQREDLILRDKVNNIIGKVVRVTVNNVEINAQLIPKMLIGNTDNIICSRRHKIFINDEIKFTRAHDILGSSRILIKEPLYNIQFMTEGTYYVENVKVESLSPNNKNYPIADTDSFCN